MTKVPLMSVTGHLNSQLLVSHNTALYFKPASYQVGCWST